MRRRSFIAIGAACGVAALGASIIAARLIVTVQRPEWVPQDAVFFDDFAATNGPLEKSLSGATWLKLSPKAGPQVVEAYVGSGTLTADQSERDTSAAYSSVSLWRPVKSMMAQISWGREARGVAALIATRNALNAVSAVTEGSIHIVFTPTHCDVGIFENGKLDFIGKPKYDPPAPGKSVWIGWKIDSDVITVFSPDGSHNTFQDPRLQTLTGTTAIWEHFWKIGEEPPVYHKVWAI